MTRAAIYARISRDRAGAGLGVDRQAAECRELATRRGWDVVATFIDNDISAFSGKVRPQYEALLGAIEGGRVEAVLAWHNDRLHRSPKELERFIDLVEHHKVAVAVVQGGDYDLTTSNGRLSARIVGAVARHESEHKSE
ncbi:MAG TPA: recombinase family protein, partial [Candidatus Binatia bacterium]|nr:recombinase family protein [Candidatus Binatia bacterium]